MKSPGKHTPHRLHWAWLWTQDTNDWRRYTYKPQTDIHTHKYMFCGAFSAWLVSSFTPWNKTPAILFSICKSNVHWQSCQWIKLIERCGGRPSSELSYRLYKLFNVTHNILVTPCLMHGTEKQQSGQSSVRTLPAGQQILRQAALVEAGWTAQGRSMYSLPCLSRWTVLVIDAQQHFISPR